MPSPLVYAKIRSEWMPCHARPINCQVFIAPIAVTSHTLPCIAHRDFPSFIKPPSFIHSFFNVRMFVSRDLPPTRILANTLIPCKLTTQRRPSSAINSSNRSVKPLPKPSFSHSPLTRCSGTTDDTGCRLIPSRSCIELGIADELSPCADPPAAVSPGAGVPPPPVVRRRLTLRETRPPPATAPAPAAGTGVNVLPPPVAMMSSAGLTVPGRWSGSPAAPEVRSERGSTRSG